MIKERFWAWNIKLYNIISVILCLIIVVVSIGGCMYTPQPELLRRMFLPKSETVINSDSMSKKIGVSVNSKYYDGSQLIIYKQNDSQLKDEKLLDNQKYDNQSYDIGLNLYQIKYDQNILLQARSYQILIRDLDESIFYEQLPPEFFDHNIDWQSVLSKFAIGTIVNIITGVILAESGVAIGVFYFVTNLKDIVGEILVGKVLNYVKNALIKNEDNNRVKEYSIADLVEEIADNYMWGSISKLAKVAFSKMIGKVIKDSRGEEIGKICKNEEIHDKDGNKIGKIVDTPEKNYLIDNSDRVKGYIDEKAVYHDENKFYDNNLTRAYTNGRQAINCRVQNGNLFYKGDKIGIIQKDKTVISLDGKNLGKITDDGLLISNYINAYRKKVYVGDDGTILNRTMKLAGKMIKGASRIEAIVNDINEVVAFKYKYVDKYGNVKYYLVDSYENKVIGILNDKERFLDNWNYWLDSEAQKAVGKAKEMGIDIITNGKKYQSIKYLSEENIDYIKKQGKYPNSIVGHHINNVANYPWLAGDPNNILLCDRKQHLIEHNGNFRNETAGKLTNLEKAYNAISK